MLSVPIGVQLPNVGLQTVPILIEPNGDVNFLGVTPNIALGILPDFKFDLQTINLNRDSVIFAYSDGVTEAENINKELYSEERLLKTIRENSSNMSPDQLIVTIWESIKSFVKDNEQSDDLTMLALAYKDIKL